MTAVAELPRPIGYVLGGGASLGAIQVGMLQALSEHGVVPDLVAGTSVGSLNGAALAGDPTSGANRLSHVWARMTTAQIFPGGLLAQVRTLQQTKTHLFPSTGLAAVIEQFLGGRDRSFDDLVVPFTAVAMDVATGRAHPIRHGPLLPALLASAAVPGIYPRVDHHGRRLFDGGIVANVPMRIAVDMGARSLVVLDCAFPSQLPILGETFAEGGSLVLSGQPGVGKSALVRYAIDVASEFRVVRSAGVESEMAFGYAGVHQVVLPILDHHGELPAPQRTALDAALGRMQHDGLDPFLVGLAVLSLVAEAARAQPLLVVVDDAQWVDDESAMALSFVGRRLGAERVVMLVAMREVSDPRARFDGLPRLDLVGLRAPEALELLTATARSVEGGVARCPRRSDMVGEGMTLMDAAPTREDVSQTPRSDAGGRPPLPPLHIHHPVVVEHAARRAADAQLRVADAITGFAGSMPFVYLHAVAFACWMLFFEPDPWPRLTLIVSLEAIFLSTFVMIGQNRQAEFQRAKADHDFATESQELRANTELTRTIHTLTTEMHRQVIGKDST